MFVDIHTHNSSKSDFPAVRNLTFQEAEIIFSSSETGFFSVGIHPWTAHTTPVKELSDLEDWASDKRFIAVGECGLDKNSKASLLTQIDIFKKQIELSEKIQKPLIIHCVGCFNEIFQLKKELNPTQCWIIHGFRGKPELAAQALKNSCALSFGEHFNEESVRLTPIDKLFVESDDNPLSIEFMYKKLAAIKKIDANEINAGTKLLEQITGKPSQI